jgi:hypothetical protein
MKSSTPPVAEGLPEFCYVAVPDMPPNLRIRIVRCGQSGSWPITSLPSAQTDDAAERIVEKANELFGVTPLQAFCMLNGSLWGWDRPGADPTWVAKRYPALYGNTNSGVTP